MARHKESASELELARGSLGVTTAIKGGARAKTQAALAAQQQYLTKHINSNGPHDQPKVAPLDFDHLSDDQLATYNERYQLGLPPAVLVSEDVLLLEIGKKTQYKRHPLRWLGGISKPELAAHCKNHFNQLPVKENEIITSFLYKVKHQDQDFKLTFK